MEPFNAIGNIKGIIREEYYKMKTKISCLILILVLTLAAFPASVQAANMFLNPSFEDDADDDGWPDDCFEISEGNWTQSGYYSIQFNLGNARTGVNNVVAGSETGDGSPNYEYFYQDITGIDAGTNHVIGGWIKDYYDGGSSAKAGIKFEFWADEAKSTLLSEQEITFTIPDDDDWHWIEGKQQSPVGTVVVTAMIGSAGGGELGAYLMDDLVFDEGPNAYNPSPADGKPVDPSTTILSWDHKTTHTCDIYWSAGDPGVTELSFDSDKVLLKADWAPDQLDLINDFEPDISLLPDKHYYWRVDCNDIGMLWTFNTFNSAPIVEAGINQSGWISSGPVSVSLSGSATDDDLPNPPGALSYKWTGSGAKFLDDTDPGTTATFTSVGTYTLTLEVKDDKDNVSGGLGKISTDTVKVFVYASGHSGLIAHWPFDATGPTWINDIEGGHNGTPVGNATRDASTAKVGAGSLGLDGDGSYLEIGDSGSTDWADGTEADYMKISCWMKVSTEGFDDGWAALVSKGDLAWSLERDGNTDGVWFVVNGYDPGSVATGGTGSAAVSSVNDGKWHHIVAVNVGNGLNLYVDGFLAESTIVEGQSLSNDRNIWIGKGYWDAYAGTYEFNGNIDEVRIYDRPLSADKVLAQFRDDGGANSCGGNYDPMDINQDCYVNSDDLVLIVNEWLDCTDVTNPDCDWATPW